MRVTISSHIYATTHKRKHSRVARLNLKHHNIAQSFQRTEIIIYSSRHDDDIVPIYVLQVTKYTLELNEKEITRLQRGGRRVPSISVLLSSESIIYANYHV